MLQIFFIIQVLIGSENEYKIADFRYYQSAMKEQILTSRYEEDFKQFFNVSALPYMEEAERKTVTDNIVDWMT